MTDTKREEFHDHRSGEDDLRAARGVFGWPLVVGCILSFLIVVGVSWLLDSPF